jgi:hypothetical protein
LGGRERGGIEYMMYIHIVKEEGGRSAEEGGKGTLDRERREEREAILPLVLCLDI